MPTYAQLRTEPVWAAQTTPLAIAALLRRCKAVGITVYSGGDEHHLKGRHRSRAWCLTSRFCTNRSYGTRDARDLAGNANWYRAVDIMLEGPPLWAACRRLDAAVRAGQLPGLAEWFGTFDGKTVVGWFEGRPGSSDTSHLTHLHAGFWTGSANDTATMDRLYGLITGTDEENDMTPDESKRLVVTGERVRAALLDGESTTRDGGYNEDRPVWIVQAIKELQAAVAGLAVPSVDAAALAKALLADPGFKAALAQAAFEGAQRAERE